MTSLSPGRIVVTYSLVAVFCSALLGVLLGYATLEERDTPGLFSSLESTPSLVIFDR